VIRFDYDLHGTPGAVAVDDIALFSALGELHGLHRPLQSLLLSAAGSGRLAEHLLPRSELVRLDAIAHRLDLPARGSREASRLDDWTALRLDAYLSGLWRGLERKGRPFELAALLASLPSPDRASVLSGFLLAAYLGLAEGQERMERAIVDALSYGADPQLLERMFEPHLAGWDPSLRPKAPGFGFAAHGMTATGGSNAWAVDGTRTASGRSLLAGDPHLMVNQLPSLFFEVRLATKDNYWLGVSIPGLPGMAICRSKHIAWSGTFGVADNIDHFVEHDGDPTFVTRTANIGRRFLPALAVDFVESPRGVLESEPEDGRVLSTAWAGSADAHQAMAAYLRLMFAESANEAVRILERAHTLSLHLVIADRTEVVFRDVGRIPRRTGGWSGLYPVPAKGERRWDGVYTGESLPVFGPERGAVLTANEARLAPDGGVLSTLAQPAYRYARILAQLDARAHHDIASFGAMQHDLFSMQADLLTPIFVDALEAGPLRSILTAWDRKFGTHSVGATAFHAAYAHARAALAPELGGSWFVHMLKESELPVWWAHAIDRVLFDRSSWTGDRGRRLREALASIAQAHPEPLGSVQRVTHRNLILGGVGLGFDRGPYPLPGSLGSICQASMVRVGGAEIAIAPAYRFITDMAEDAIYSTLPGGIDGSRFSPTYDRWLDDHYGGRYHRTEPPQ
jgi:penicillin G amidase